MARWRQSFIYNGPDEAVEVLGLRFPRGEGVVIALDKWNRGYEKMLARAGVKYLGLVDVLAVAVPQARAPEPAMLVPEPEPAPRPAYVWAEPKRRGRPRGSD